MFVRVTETFGRAAPVGSVTVPTTVASWAKTCRDIAKTSPERTNSHRIRRLHSANEDENFTARLLCRFPPYGRSKIENVTQNQPAECCWASFREHESYGPLRPK